jgi:FtsP/CotA-like multicopper oxidase with cupredoxin domain
MKPMMIKIAYLKTRLLLPLMVAVASLAATAHAAAPGIIGSVAGNVSSFTLTAQAAYLNQPDGASVYSWGYGCTTAPAANRFVPAGMPNAFCSTMQVPGPTIVVTEGQTVSVTLTNNLPTPAGNTSIIFSGLRAAGSGGVQGLLTREATPGSTVTYSFFATTPGTHSYYSGTQSDLQVEMGLYGAIIVLPKTVPAACTTGLHASNRQVEIAHTEADWRLAAAAYDHDKSCYDREYLFQFSEMDPRIHTAALAQVNAKGSCTAGAVGCSLEVPTEPYHPAYYLINGRSMPDDMDPNYDTPYPHQPYNGNPHMHPGELVLLRIIGQGRWQHPFHEHANHVRILARDANLILSSTNAEDLAGAPLFTTTTTPGETMDGIFYFTGRGLNWDMYGHHPGDTADPSASLPCYPDANGYYTTLSSPAAPVSAINYYEWCQDHNKPLELTPTGDVASGGPATLPNPLILTTGPWFGGSPYLGDDATTRAVGPNTFIPPSGTQANPAGERGFAFMWHSHNEREITTNNVFPGGMLMMMLVDSREFVIDESL